VSSEILGILGIENRKPKIVNFFSLSVPTASTKKKIILFYFLKISRPRTAEGREGEGGGEGRGGEGRGGRERGGEGGASVQTHGRVRLDAHCFTRGNFKKDAIVRPSHVRPRGHHPTVWTSGRPSSENGRVTTLIEYSLLRETPNFNVAY
jgi:hypothetical protein